ncbi:MAG: phosphopantetheine-binding protein, partial [Firmicutes bacterium]|nr:phosphopantetheine-binding protein [Bacillota bacterium]
ALKTINCIGYPLFNGYGTTETAIAGANLAKKIAKRTNGSIGNPFKSVSYLLEDDGTLTVKGNSICKKIISLKDQEVGFDSIKTNDLIKVEKGQFFIKGRKSDLFIGQNGENISPDTIQSELKIKTANRLSVLQLFDKLCIVLEYGQMLPDIAIANEINQIKQQLPSIPFGQNISDIFITKNPIANPNAIKVSRSFLRKKIEIGEVVITDYKNLTINNAITDDLADDATMQCIKQAFKKALDTDTQVNSNSDFFVDLNGTSLDYISLINEIEITFNIKINLELSRSLRTPTCFYKHICEAL